MPWEGSKRRKEEKTHRESVCVGIATEGVRSVKRKGSDQRRDETMVEARGRQGRVGGTVKATKLYVHIATLLFYLLSLWECFSFMISSLFFFFFFLPGSCTHPPTHQQSSPFIPALHLLGKGSSTAIKRCGHTVPHSFVTLRIE